MAGLAGAFRSADGRFNIAPADLDQFNAADLEQIDPAAYEALLAKKRKEEAQAQLTDDEERTAETSEARDNDSVENRERMVLEAKELSAFEGIVSGVSNSFRHMMSDYNTQIENINGRLSDMQQHAITLRDGRHVYLSRDRSQGEDDQGNGLSAEDLQQARALQADRPDAPTMEQHRHLQRQLENARRHEGQIGNAQTQIQTLQAQGKPKPGEPDYDQRLAQYERQWASIVKGLSEDDRERVFKENPGARSAYDKYKDQVQPAYLGPAPDNSVRADTAAPVPAPTGSSLTDTFTRKADGAAHPPQPAATPAPAPAASSSTLGSIVSSIESGASNLASSAFNLASAGAKLISDNLPTQETVQKFASLFAPNNYAGPDKGPTGMA